MQKNKVLIIRFSSFGDIVQCSNILECFASNDEIHWVTRLDFYELVGLNKKLNKVHFLDRKKGIFELIRLSLSLRKEKFTHIYDAHNNLRSKILLGILLFRFSFPKVIIRPKNRMKRMMLFKFRKNYFSWPFKGAISYLQPLNKWNIHYCNDLLKVDWSFNNEVVSKVESIFGSESFIALIPSAAWDMKRWPVEYWKKLIELMPGKKFVILGGKEDHFCEELVQGNEERVKNLAGKLTLVESMYLMRCSSFFVSGDTGLLHVADSLNKNGIALIGPSAFGYTTSKNIKTLEMNLDCKPCSKDGSGKCVNQLYKRCLVEITPELVVENIKKS